MRDHPRAALIVVDIQPDFMPGGALPVPQGGAILPPVVALLEHAPVGVVVATQDWHPRQHASFASRHPGRKPFDTVLLHSQPQTLWPDHCVQGTPGAALHPDLPLDRVALILRKGMDPDCDSYSAFRHNWDAAGARPSTGLAGYLHERQVTSVYVCGLARDFCVLWSALDAVQAGFRTAVVWDLTRPVVAADDPQTRHTLDRHGVLIVGPDLEGAA